MLDRMCVGHVPAKNHTTHFDAEGALLWEHCLTTRGFEGPYTIAWHQQAPHTWVSSPARHGWVLPSATEARVQKRHFRSHRVRSGGPAINARTPLLFNDDIVFSVLRPDTEDPVYLVNGDADELYFALEGAGTLRTPLGDVRFEEHDYVFVPRGLPHRLLPDGPSVWYACECTGGVRLPQQWRNDAGQLRMDAPYNHRDFRRPNFEGPRDDGVRQIVLKKANRFAGFTVAHSLLNVTGWDGTLYPWAFPIRAFQPRVSAVHLPPSWHGTFTTRGALICSFVPRPVDFGDAAIPCPYPHSSFDVDEVLLYCDGAFTSRRGVGPGSVSLHPAGVPHGPHPGAREASIGTTHTSELAVMIDVSKPLSTTAAAVAVEDQDYEAGFGSAHTTAEALRA